MITLFLALLFCHYLFDYPLQGDFIARAKNSTNPIPGVPWYQVMFAHTFMHGAAVTFVTGMWTLGLLEMLVHWYTDHLKCNGKLTFNQDQGIHIVSKLVWAYVAITTMVQPEAIDMVYQSTLV